MSTPEILRSQAAACRRAAALGKRGTNRYLVGLAEDYEREAVELETAGNKPQRPQPQEPEKDPPDRPLGSP